MIDPIFLAWYIKGPTLRGIPVHAHSFRSEIFRGFLFLLFDDQVSLGFRLREYVNWFLILFCKFGNLTYSYLVIELISDQPVRLGHVVA